MLSEAEVTDLKQHFPIFNQTVHGHPLVYLDSASTTQKPQSVISALSDYYQHYNANIHRGVHHLSEQATAAFEASRAKVAKFINAKHVSECVFVRGTTEAINLVATSFGQWRCTPGDEILISALEHHSNIVPWQLLCERQQLKLKVIPMTDTGELDLGALDTYLTPRTRLVALIHTSNSLGTINPVKTVIDRAHAKGIPVLLDAAQATAHHQLDVQALDCDFLAFSGHKMYGPMGIGVLYGKQALLEQMPPYQGGGDMILQVSFNGSDYNSVPYKFEAGTPAVPEAIGLGAAIDFLQHLDLSQVLGYEQQLIAYAKACLQAIPNLRFYGPDKHKIGVLSFTLEGVHPHDIGSILDQAGVAIRTGHHCTMPIMTHFGIPATARVSLGLYNTPQDIDTLKQALLQVNQLFGK